MKNLKSKILNLKSGYAILFTLVIVTIIMSFAMGMSNSAYKQTILSSTARDSQIAFYQADTAGECALYVLGRPVTLAGGVNYFCGGIDAQGQPISLNVQQITSTNFHLEKDSPRVDEPFFTIDMDFNTKTIIARGYNIFDPTGNRKVERALKITY